VRTVLPSLHYGDYADQWDAVSRAGRRHLNFDTWAAGHRYLSLAALTLTAVEADQLRDVTVRFSRLLDRAVEGVLADSDWWTALAWPWAAIELARQEPVHPGGHASLYGRFDCLLDRNGAWKVIEFNADTPSGGREASGLEPAIARLYPGLRPVTHRLSTRLTHVLQRRIQHRARPVRLVGIVSSHSWLEDMAQAFWLAGRLRRAGVASVVGDVTDLATSRGKITLRGRRIDALYRFYPVERLYRHAIFASLCEAALDGQLLLLNGLRGFLAQSKACLAWLWSNRGTLPSADREAIERHLPETVLARDPSAIELLPRSVVKHVNGREGDSVVFGELLDTAAWEARLLEGGYVVQRAVDSVSVEDVEVDDFDRTLRCVDGRYACVGAFSIAGHFGGCYTRLDGPITSARATYVATLTRQQP
jgi:glutathionylspermidine synthase